MKANTPHRGFFVFFFHLKKAVWAAPDRPLNLEPNERCRMCCMWRQTQLSPDSAVPLKSVEHFSTFRLFVLVSQLTSHQISGSFTSRSWAPASVGSCLWSCVLQHWFCNTFPSIFLNKCHKVLASAPCMSEQERQSSLRWVGQYGWNIKSLVLKMGQAPKTLDPTLPHSTSHSSSPLPCTSFNTPKLQHSFSLFQVPNCDSWMI